MVSRLTGPFENEDEAWEDAENNLFPGVKLRDGGGRLAITNGKRVLGGMMVTARHP